MSARLLYSFVCLTVCATRVVAAGPAPSTASPLVSIFYSFDTTPPPGVLEAVKAETARIFEPASLTVRWRHLGPVGGEADGEIVIARFHGACSAGAWSSGSQLPGAGGFPLADSKTSDGQVLPFADIDCSAIERYLAGQRFADAGVALGTAMARVLAHEIYHILTASEAHARTGIARAEHSRDDLTAARFEFGKPELEWLRYWSARNRAPATGDYAFGSADEPGEETGQTSLR